MVTMKEWLSQNWGYVAAGGGIIGLVYVLKNAGGNRTVSLAGSPMPSSSGSSAGPVSTAMADVLSKYDLQKQSLEMQERLGMAQIESRNLQAGLSYDAQKSAQKNALTMGAINSLGPAGGNILQSLIDALLGSGETPSPSSDSTFGSGQTANGDYYGPFMPSAIPTAGAGWNGEYYGPSGPSEPGNPDFNWGAGGLLPTDGGDSSGDYSGDPIGGEWT